MGCSLICKQCSAVLKVTEDVNDKEKERGERGNYTNQLYDNAVYVVYSQSG